MTEVMTAGGVLVDLLDEKAAERLSTKISLRLDAIADNYTAVMPLIREAIERQAHIALGYRSPGEYISDRFGGALSKLGLEVRREVVRELTEAGLSTRAIAPIVGVSNFTVSKDQTAVRDLTPPTPAPSGAGRSATSVALSKVAPGEADARAADAVELKATPPVGESGPRPPVTGLDGKTYTRPTLVPRATPIPSVPTRPASRRPLPDAFFDAAYDLTKVTERIDRLVNDDRFPQNAEKVTARYRNDLLRAVELLSKALDRLA